MEGADVDWKMGEEEGKSNVKWIFEKGFDIAKKVVLTGLLISSAPLIIPPVVIVSMLALAFSIPLGVVFMSYACTKKVMNTLLPMPTSYTMLEHQSVFEYKDEEENVGRLVGDGDEDRSCENEGNKEDVGKYLEEEEERPGGGIDVKIEGEGEEEEKDPPTKEERKDDEPLPVSSGEKIDGEGVKAEKDPIKEEKRDDETLPESSRGKIEGEGVEAEKSPIKEEKKEDEEPSLGELKQENVEKNKDESNAGDTAKKKKKIKKKKN